MGTRLLLIPSTYLYDCSVRFCARRRLPRPSPPIFSAVRRNFYEFRMEVPLGISKADGTGGERGGDAEAGKEVMVQYVVVRRDLIDSWAMGSIVTQGCHASVAAIWAHREDGNTLRYLSPEKIDSMHKVTLEVKGETQLRNLSEKLNGGGIDHKLWIEQPENIPTCLATKPYPKSEVSPYFRKLKLCK